jgi:hypothetical protein
MLDRLFRISARVGGEVVIGEVVIGEALDFETARDRFEAKCRDAQHKPLPDADDVYPGRGRYRGD